MNVVSECPLFMYSLRQASQKAFKRKHKEGRWARRRRIRCWPVRRRCSGHLVLDGGCLTERTFLRTALPKVVSIENYKTIDFSKI